MSIQVLSFKYIKDHLKVFEKTQKTSWNGAQVRLFLLPSSEHPTVFWTFTKSLLASGAQVDREFTIIHIISWRFLKPHWWTSTDLLLHCTKWNSEIQRYSSVPYMSKTLYFIWLLRWHFGLGMLNTSNNKKPTLSSQKKAVWECVWADSVRVRLSQPDDCASRSKNRSYNAARLLRSSRSLPSHDNIKELQEH